MKPWWQVAVPHRDIREGRIGDFAADLRSIIKGEASIEYVNPEIFFRRTHLTKGLENIVKDVLFVLSKKEEKGKVIQLQTPFGGGKTHALVYLYHFFKSGKDFSYIDDLKKILDSCELKNIPETKVVVFVGTVSDPLEGKTPWGEIAEQLGVYKLVEEHDKKRISPGREKIEKILNDNKPVLLLIDELTEYIVRAKEFEDQVFAFFHELTEAISKSLTQCVLVCTLPSSAPYGERGERVLNQLQRIFGRMQTIYTPVEGEEIYEVIRKRLFEDLGNPREHEAVASEYFNLYQKLGEEVPSEVREISYKEKIKKAYPFHPEVINVLFERWGAIPTFQRTRGVLRLLAEVVSDLFKRQDPSPLIQPASINLANPRIRRMFVEHIGEIFESVLASDIVGDNARAVKLDRQMGSEYVRFGVATGLATSIFFYSFPATERRGVTIQRLRVAFLREGIPPAIIGDALRRLEDLDGPLYLHFEKGLYYFSSQVGLNKIIVEKEEAIKEMREEIEEEMKRRLEKLVGKDFEIFIWPKSSSDVPDNKKMKLIILPFKLEIDNPDTKKFIQDIITNYSSGYRTYKNTLIFLVSDPNEYNGLRELVCRFLALKTINKDKEIWKTLTETDKEKVNKKLKEIDSTIDFKIVSTYRYLFKASRDGVRELDMGIPTVGEISTLSRRIKDYLKDQEVLLEKISPKVLFEKTFSEEDERKSVAEIIEAFLKFPELPMVEDEHVIKNSIVQGVQTGIFGLLIDDKIWYLQTISPNDISEEAFVIRKEVAQKMKEEVGVSTGIEAKLPIEAPGTKIAPEKGEGVIRKVALRVTLPWDRLSDLIRGVFTPLSREGAQISLEVKIEAESKQGIRRDTLDLKIKETLNQIGAKVLEEKEE
ncbi:MAG: DUF499 domain-containing protein [Candidatus Aenigmatarchaeota archaeon]